MDVIEGVIVESKPAVPPKVLREGTGWPLGAGVFSAGDWQKAAVFNVLPSARVDSKMLELLAHVFGGATAGSFFSIDEANKLFHYSTIYLPALSAEQEPDRHANVGLRLGRLVTVKAAFGLSNTDFAAVCRVSRAALYKWLSQDETLHLSPGNWQRLSELANLASDWNKISSSPPSQLLNEPLEGGITLLSLLSTPQLNQGAIHDAMKKLADMLPQRPPRRDEKLRQAGIKPRPLIGQLQRDD